VEVKIVVTRCSYMEGLWGYAAEIMWRCIVRCRLIVDLLEVDVFHIVQLSPCHVRSLKARTANAVLWRKLKVALGVSVRTRIRTSASSSTAKTSHTLIHHFHLNISILL